MGLVLSTGNEKPMLLIILTIVPRHEFTLRKRCAVPKRKMLLFFRAGLTKR